MSPAIAAIAPDYVRLSGEIADQTVLDSLRQAFPTRRIGHAYASTEAGVGFEVNDGLEGFPASFVGTAPARGRDEGRGRIAAHPLGAHRVPLRRHADLALLDADGFVDTGDMVELRGRALLFRRSARRHHQRRRPEGASRGGRGGDQPPPRRAGCRWSRAARTRSPAPSSSRRSCSKDGDGEREADRCATEILAACRERLPPHKVPAMLRFVPALDVTPAGKLVRAHA